MQSTSGSSHALCMVGSATLTLITCALLGALGAGVIGLVLGWDYPFPPWVKGALIVGWGVPLPWAVWVIHCDFFTHCQRYRARRGG